VIGRRPPPDVRDRAGGRDTLAWAAVDDGWLVATRDRLLLPDGDEPTWDAVVRATWDAPVLELVLADRRVLMTLEEPGRVPDVVNERVKASVVAQHHVPLRGDAGVRLVARRTPGGSGVTWRVTFDAGLDPADPRLREAADSALAELRAALGL
jgi:hypothetical protein